jgi:hypothetical protein
MIKALAVLLTFGLLNLPILQAAPVPEGRANRDEPQDQPVNQQQDQGPAYEAFSPEQLDNLLSPIALYPDPLLAQLFVAATFPDQVEEAARYVRANGQNGLDDQNWDVSVRAIAHYPTVVEMMGDKIDWTTSVGQAYVNQSSDVASSVQRLRHMARGAGNLQSSDQQEVLEHDNYIAISPYQPQYIYVPAYDPAVVYYRRPYWGPPLTFGVGFPIGSWLNLDFRWGYGGGWGGVYYTGWRQGGWGRDCWNCAWIDRSRGRINIANNVYINNRYDNINVNRSVINRVVNPSNLNRYNSIHRNVNYNNVQANNTRANRVINGNAGRLSNPVANGSGARPNTSPNTRPGVSNKIIDRNIVRNNPQIDQYRGRDTTPPKARPPAVQQRPATAPAPRPANRPSAPQPQARRPVPQPQIRQAPQPQVRPAPHALSPKEGNFSPRISSQRGQASRQQAPQARPVPQPKAQPKPAPQPKTPKKPSPSQPHGGGKKKA